MFPNSSNKNIRRNFKSTQLLLHMSLSNDCHLSKTVASIISPQLAAIPEKLRGTQDTQDVD